MLQTTTGILEVVFLNNRANYKYNHRKKKVINVVIDAGKVVKSLPKVEKSKNAAKFKKPELGKTIDKVSGIDFLILEAKTAFLHLQTAFIKALVLYYFDLKSHIRIQTNTFGYVIGKILSQLTLNQNSSSYVIEKNLNFSKSD